MTAFIVTLYVFTPIFHSCNHCLCMLTVLLTQQSPYFSGKKYYFWRVALIDFSNSTSILVASQVHNNSQNGKWKTLCK